MTECTSCGRRLDLAPCGAAGHEGGMSAPDDSLDAMIQGASVPSLATLFRKAKERGVIGPVSVYGEGAPTP